MGLFGGGTAGRHWRVTGLGLKPKSAGAFSMLAWMNPAVAANVLYGCMIGVPASAASGAFAIIFQFGSGFRMRIDDTGGGGYIPQIAGSQVAGQWNMVLGVSENVNTAGTVYRTLPNSSDLASNTAAGSFPTDPVWDDITVHAFVGPSASVATDLVAEVAVWNRPLGLRDAQMLAEGTNPLALRGAPPLFYWPLRGNLNSYGQVKTALAPVNAATITKFGAHPPVQPMPVRRLLRPAGVTAPAARRPRITMVA